MSAIPLHSCPSNSAVWQRQLLKRNPAAVKIKSLSDAAIDGAKKRQGVLVGTLDELVQFVKQLLNLS